MSTWYTKVPSFKFYPFPICVVYYVANILNDFLIPGWWSTPCREMPAIYRDDREVVVLSQILHLTDTAQHHRLFSQFPSISSSASIRHTSISRESDVTKLRRSALISTWLERYRYHYRWCRERHTSYHGLSSSDRRTAAHTHQAYSTALTLIREEPCIERDDERTGFSDQRTNQEPTAASSDLGEVHRRGKLGLHHPVLQTCEDDITCAVGSCSNLIYILLDNSIQWYSMIPMHEGVKKFGRWCSLQVLSEL